MTELLNHLETVAVLVFLVSSMAAMGLTLTPRAIAAPLRDVRFVLLALALNFVLAPACAWLLTIVIPLDRGHAAGLMLLGGAAGAPFLPKLVETARGDLGSAAALMALLTAGTILFMPFALPLMIAGLTADPWSIARPLLMLIIAPLAVGMVVKSCAASFAARAAPVLGKDRQRRVAAALRADDRAEFPCAPRRHRQRRDPRRAAVFHRALCARLAARRLAPQRPQSRHHRAQLRRRARTGRELLRRSQGHRDDHRRRHRLPRRLLRRRRLAAASDRRVSFDRTKV
jgi:hypothetical protein